MIVRMLGIQVWNRNDVILAAIVSAQRCTNAVLSDFGIRVVTVVQDHELYVAKDNLNRVVVGTAFGQIDPGQFNSRRRWTTSAGWGPLWIISPRATI